jgi:sterol desaturase/sphingolipid hydroxylase (fatty acid hydroxylase superfamily)
MTGPGAPVQDASGIWWHQQPDGSWFYFRPDVGWLPLPPPPPVVPERRFQGSQTFVEFLGWLFATIVVLFVLGVIVLVASSGGGVNQQVAALQVTVVIVVVVGAVWVGFDHHSTARLYGTDRIGVGWGTWVLGCLFLWLIFFPVYLTFRRQQRRSTPLAPAGPKPRRQREWPTYVVFVFSIAALIGACWVSLTAVSR